jgi:hypothetical protein
MGDQTRARADSTDELVDRFVAAVNAGYREPISPDPDGSPYPTSILIGAPDEHGWYDWAIKPYAGVDWIEPTEQRLGRRLHAAYRSLVTRYIFPSFEAGDVLFFANTPEGTEFYEFRARLLLDEYLYPTLLRARFVQIGQPAEGSYDPVCFAPWADSEEDAPLVRLDHESILCDGVVEVVNEVAPSLRHLMTAVIERADAMPHGE